MEGISYYLKKKKLYFNRINQTGPKLSNELVNVYKIR